MLAKCFTVQSFPDVRNVLQPKFKPTAVVSKLLTVNVLYFFSPVNSRVIIPNNRKADLVELSEKKNQIDVDESFVTKLWPSLKVLVVKPASSTHTYSSSAVWNAQPYGMQVMPD